MVLLCIWQGRMFWFDFRFEYLLWPCFEIYAYGTDGDPLLHCLATRVDLDGHLTCRSRRVHMSFKILRKSSHRIYLVANLSVFIVCVMTLLPLSKSSLVLQVFKSDHKRAPHTHLYEKEWCWPPLSFTDWHFYNCHMTDCRIMYKAFISDRHL